MDEFDDKGEAAASYKRRDPWIDIISHANTTCSAVIEFDKSLDSHAEIRRKTAPLQPSWNAHTAEERTDTT